MAERPKIPADVEKAILVKSKRRCCLCFHLHDDIDLKKGQIAHLDHEPANNGEDNLAWLCLVHHDEYDSRTSQTKGFKIAEVKHWRDQLYEQLAKSEAAEKISTVAARAEPANAKTIPKRMTAAEVDMLLDLRRPRHGGAFSKDLPPGPIARSQLETAARLANRGFLDDHGRYYALSTSGKDEADGLWQMRILQRIAWSPKHSSDSTNLSVELDLDQREVVRHFIALDQLGMIVLQHQVNFSQARINDAGMKQLEGSQHV
jgi:hypothetical protein